jgi:hypothetical protein
LLCHVRRHALSSLDRVEGTTKDFAPCRYAVATIYLVGNCDSPRIETLPSYLIQLGVVSHHSLPLSSFARQNRNAELAHVASFRIMPRVSRFMRRDRFMRTPSREVRAESRYWQRATAARGTGELCLQLDLSISSKGSDQPAWSNLSPVAWDYLGIHATLLRSYL